MFKLLVLLTLTYSFNSFAFLDGCAKDIFKVGASLDSAVFNANRDGKELDLVSDQGLGIRLHWIVFCPESGVETTPYFYFRNYSFKSNSDFQEPPSDIESFTLGVDFSKRISFLGSKFDLILGLATREETIIAGASELYKRNYDNTIVTIVTIGFQKGLYSFKKAKGSFKFVAGALFADQNSVDTGFTTRISTDLLMRLSQKYSLVFDLFLDYYDQKDRQDNIEFSRTEIGLASNFLFRF